MISFDQVYAAPTNIGPLAAVTASSENASTGQLAVKAVDGVADGYPGDYTKEWATLKEKSGAWLQLTWSSAYLVDRIILYDRPNTGDQILSATLSFSDGSTLQVGPLDNVGGATEYTFTAKVITSVAMTVDQASSSTLNVGLSEIEIYGESFQGNLPPVADAGTDQTVNEGQLVYLDGSGSYDPDPDPLTYLWQQTASDPIQVTLSDPTAVNPSFTAPTGLSQHTPLTFNLVVNDGQLDSAVDSVVITVLASQTTYSNIAPLAAVTASSENASTNQLAVKAVDGVADGYPGDYTREWATLNEKSGAWLQLTWSSAYLVDRIILYDRPNTGDQILSATLSFSDGSTLQVGPLDNTGLATEYTFTAKVITSVVMTVDQASSSTNNTGLAEIEVYGEPYQGSLPPVADAGPDQTVNEGQLVYLDGSGSYDPDPDPLTYLWQQAASDPIQVTLSNPTTVNPSFTAPTGLSQNTPLTFDLVVNDGQLDSAVDSVIITVLASQTTYSNIASLAAVTASSENASTGQLAVKAVDGVADGYPGDYTREWATLKEKSGAWLQLTWPSAYLVDRIVLYDRPNTGDQILSATLSFSDGSTLQVGPLDNVGGATEYTFTAKVITSAVMTVDQASSSTNNIGLSEIEIYGESFQGNLPPVADAGPDQTVNEGQLVYLDGSGSYDPDPDPLTYLWQQAASDPIQVTLSDPTAVNPSFTAPTGLSQNMPLTFDLVVNDGQVDSAVDSVVITVLASQTTYSNIASLAAVTASSENASSGQLAVKAVDGVADGYPGDYTKEWATLKEKSGAWLQLTWSSAYLVDRIILYDRPNTGDQILSATLSFSDGSILWTGALDNQGGPTEYNFDSKIITDLTLTVFKVSGGTSSVGLAEIEIFGSPCIPPNIIIGQPHTYDLQTSPDLYVLAGACLESPTDGVRFLIDGGSGSGGQQFDDYTKPYDHTFLGLSASEHVVDARIINESGTEITGPNTQDQAVQVGIGNYLVATGDSITFGYGGVLNTSQDGRNTDKGFEPLLNDQLTSSLSIPHTVVNEGVSGQISAYGASEIDTILAKHPNAQRILVQWGTNDADPVWYAVPSGLGLNPGDPGYPGSFKDNMQQIIDAINNDGKEACLAKLPIVIGVESTGPKYADPANPPTGSRGDFVMQYNAVIDELKNDPPNNITVTPPDFWALFNENVTGGRRYDFEYFDNIHPNGTGYQSMANRWFQVLTQ